MSDIIIMLGIVMRWNMKKIIGFSLGVALLCGISNSISLNAENTVSAQETYTERLEMEQVSNAEGLQIGGKASYLMDFSTQTVMHAQNEREHLPIASMCKIMTLLLSFEGIERGDFQLDDEICISEHASSMGGSQVFLEAHAKYPIKELLKSIVVCSANDSCVAMAEKIAGSEGVFVEKIL